MKFPKVLIFSPTYEGKEYCRERFVETINKIKYPNFDFIMIDNSKTEDYYNKLKKEGIDVRRVPRGNNSREALAASQNYARRYALDNNYDYVLSIESDIFPPTTIIQDLMKHWKPVIGAWYLIGGTTEKIPKHPCVFLLDNSKHGATRLITLKEHEQAKEKGGLQQVHGMGVGCTLIDINVLKEQVFWCDNRFTNKHSDVYFYMDLWNKKVPVYVNYDVYVEHQPSDWSLVHDR